MKISRATNYECISDLYNAYCQSFLNDSNFKYFKDVNQENCHLNVENCVLSRMFNTSNINNPEQSKYLRVRIEETELDKIPDKFFDDFPNILYLDIWYCHFKNLEADDLKNANNLISLIIEGHNISSLSANLFENAPNLQELSIFRSDFTNTIDENAISDLKNLRKFNVERNNIDSIPDRLMKENSLLTYVSFGHNKIKTINEIHFTYLHVLWMLLLYDNEITSIHENAFENLLDLEYLALADNKISFLEKNIFHKLEKLKQLTLSNNLLTIIESELFQNLPNLEILHLNGNNVTVLPEGLFKNNPLIEELTLSRNQIEVIHQSTFAELLKLNNLNIANNKLQKVSPNAFANTNKLTYIDLSNNICVNTYFTKNYGAKFMRNFQKSMANSNCTVCSVPEVNNGDIVSALFGDPFEEYVKRFQTAKVQCHPGYSYLSENEDDVATCDGDNFNEEFPECISKNYYGAI